MNVGVLAGYPVVDVSVRLVDGSHHAVDSSEMGFLSPVQWRLRMR